MRRSTRLEAASTSKRKTKMSTLLAARAQRIKREMDDGELVEMEDGEEMDPGNDSDFIASEDEDAQGEEEDEEEDEEEEEEMVALPRASAVKRRATTARTTSKRKAVELSDSSEEDEQMASKAPPAHDVKKKKRGVIMLDEFIPVPPAGKPKPILKRPKHTQALPPSHPPPEMKSESRVVEAVLEPHRRPGKQRGTLLSGKTSALFGGGSSDRGGVAVGNTLTQFFNEILEWRFYDALLQQARKSFAVVTDANDGSEEGEVEITKVPSTFTSYAHYFSVWKPLALEEVQAQTLNNVSTDRPSPIPVIASAMGSAFHERTGRIRLDIKKGGAPTAMKRIREQLDSLFVNDLLLLTPNRHYFRMAFQLLTSNGDSKIKADDDSSDNQGAHEGSGFLAIVTTARGSRDGLSLTVLATDWARFEPMREDLFVFKLNNLVTSVREFRALCDCEHYRLMPLLLSGEHRPGSMLLDSLGLGYVRWLRSAFNESQLEAITAAATSEGFTLIKGPPGTGKTTTLKGLLNSLHLREYSRYYNAVLDVARRPDHETNKAWARLGNEKPHILVTAPSNAAVDNIVGKIMEQGFCDGEGRKYFPKIVRVGRGMSIHVKSVGLEDMVDQICSQQFDELQRKLIILHQEIQRVEVDSVALRNRLREVVAAIDLDPQGILAREKQQLEMQRQLRQQQMQPPRPPSPSSPEPPTPAEPLPTPDWASMPSPPPPSVQLSPSAPRPLPPFHLSSPPPLVIAHPASPPALHSLSPPVPLLHGAFSMDIEEGEEEEGEEEDEAFPLSYGPATTTTYNAEATSTAYNAFFHDGDDSGEEEDEPLPNSSASRPDHQEGEDKDEEDEAFPTLPAPPAPEPVTETDATTDNDEAMPDRDESPVENEAVAVKDVQMDSPDEPAAPPEPSPLTIVVDDGEAHPTSPPPPPPSHSPSSPPPPPPPMSPPPVPPLSPPPPPPPGSPPFIPNSPSSPIPQVLGPIDYGQYHQYRLTAQQINSCLERLDELRLEANRYRSALRHASEGGKNTQQLRQSLEVSFLDTAHIVFTTLSSAGVAALDACTKFDVLVVDEAAQAVELSSIIPMKFGSRQCVLVGDPQQLSATVFSRSSGVSLYERSLFERLETTGHPVHMLRTQYRSHPLISAFPRHYFYEDKLQDGANVKGPDYTRPYHRIGAGAFAPLVFWNLLSSRETTRSVSRFNAGEAAMAVNLYLTLKNACPPDMIAGKVGVITPYSQQMEELRNCFRRALGADRFENEVEINTVDGFQGREKDIIILSTVRADPKAGVGFLNDIRRMNVALTRAKFACYVIGSELTLRSSKPWAALMDHAYATQCVVHVVDPNCNLLQLKAMDKPQAALVDNQRPGDIGRRSGGRGGGGRGRGQHHPPPNVHIPPSPQHPFSGGGQPRRSSPGGHSHEPRGVSPSGQGFRGGGRGRGGGEGGNGGRGPRDPRIGGRNGGRNGRRGGRGSSPSGGHPYGGEFASPHPSHPLDQPPMYHPPPTHNGQYMAPPPAPPMHPSGYVHDGPPNPHFAHGPPPSSGLLPPPSYGYPAPSLSQGSPPGPSFPAPPPHFQQPQAYPPPPAFNGPPTHEMAPPLPQFHNGGRGRGGGRTRDPRLVRRDGRP